MRLVRKQNFSPLPPLGILILPDSLTTTPFVEEVPHASQTRDKASHIGGNIQSGRGYSPLRVVPT